MGSFPTTLFAARRKITFVICALLITVAFPPLLVCGLASLASTEDSVSPWEQIEIYSKLPKNVGDSVEIYPDVEVKRTDYKRKEVSETECEMGGESVKYEFVDKYGSYRLLITYDDLPKAITYVIFHPEEFEGFVDMYENDGANAWLIKQASEEGISDWVKLNLPDNDNNLAGLAN